MKRNKKEIEKFLIHYKNTILEKLISVYLKGRNIPLEITVGEKGSFTDGNKLIVTIPTEEALTLSISDVTKIAKFLTYHEASHVRFTDNAEYENVVREMTDLWKKKAEEKGVMVREKYLYGFASKLLNALCDGRIENILVTLLPGLRKLRDWYRLGVEWQNYDISSEENPLLIVFNCILDISTCGLYSMGFDFYYPPGTAIRDTVDRCIEPITRYVTATSVRKGKRAATEIAGIISDLVLESYSSETEPSEGLDEKYNEPIDSVNFNNDYSAEEGPDGPVIGVFEELDTENGLFSDLRRLIPGDTSEITEAKTNIEIQEAEDISEKADTSDYEETEEKQADEDQYSSMEYFESLREKARDFDAYVKEKIGELSEELSNETAFDVKTTYDDIEASKRVCDGATDLNDEDQQFLKDEGYLEIFYDIKNNHFKPRITGSAVPEDILRRGSQTRSVVENIIAVRQETDREDVYSGEMSEQSLGKFICGRGDIFRTEGEEKEPSLAVYIAKDDSRSMYGHKEEMACRALSEIEEIFKVLVPLKITAFRENDSDVIKEWDEKESRNYSWDFHLNHNPYGSNHDALAIMNGAMQLLKRPEESKLLIIISDGLPCCSPESVHKAVEWTRKNGIFVISFFIGSEEEVTEMWPVFKAMYSRYFCGVNPKILGTTLVKFLRTFIEE